MSDEFLIGGDNDCYDYLDDLYREEPIETILRPGVDARLAEGLLEEPVTSIPLSRDIQEALKALGCIYISDLFELNVNKFTTYKHMDYSTIKYIRECFDSWTSTYYNNMLIEQQSYISSCSIDDPLISLPNDLQNIDQLLKYPIDIVFDLTPSILKAFNSLGCNYVGDLLNVSIGDFINIRGMSLGKVNHIRKLFNEYINDHANNNIITYHINDDILLLVGYSYSFDCQLTQPIRLYNYQYVTHIPIPSNDINNLTSLEFNGDEFHCPNYAKNFYISWLVDDPDINHLHELTIEDAILYSHNNNNYLHYVESAINNLNNILQITLQANNSKQLIAQCIVDSNIKSSAKSIEIYIERNATKPPQKLQAIGHKLGITRERVRQIDAKVLQYLDLESSRRFYPIRLMILAAALELGGTGLVDDLVNIINSSGFPFEGDIQSLIFISPDILVDKTGTTFELKDLPCKECKSLSFAIKHIIDEKKLTPLDDLYNTVGCKQCAVSPSGIWLKQYFRGISSENQLIGPIDNPMLSSSRNNHISNHSILRMILYQASGSLSCNEIASEFEAITSRQISKNAVNSHVGRMKDVMLWDRGSYIHEKNAPFPKQLLQRIINWILDTFIDRNTPILGTWGIFDHFQKELLSEDIPTVQALYSLIRRFADPHLQLKEYPWICNAIEIGDRTSFAKYFYSILEQNNGFISDIHAETIAEKAMTQTYALSNLAEYSPFLIHANGGWYDIEAAKFNMDGIRSLAYDVASKMRENDIISAKRVFSENPERCIDYGVKSYDMLYYLIDLMEDDLPLEATRKPYLVKSVHKGLSILGAIRLYIKESNNPVSLEKLYDEFVIKRKIGKNNISKSLICNEDIIEIGKDLLWSCEKLQIDRSFIEQFNLIITSKIKYVHKISHLYYPRMQALPTYEDLPAINGLKWTNELLSAAFSKSDRFSLFGENDSCIVDMQETPYVYDTETFFYALIQNEFMGWTTFSKFADYCKSYSIKANCEPEFFDVFESIRADQFSIEAI